MKVMCSNIIINEILMKMCNESNEILLVMCVCVVMIMK